MSMICDVFDVVVIDNATGEVAGSTTLTSSNIAVEVQEQEVRAGKGNGLVAILHSARDINVECEDVSFKYDWMARKLGQTIVTGAGVAYAMPDWYTVVMESSAKVITLPSTPTSIDTLAIFDKNGAKLVKTTDYTLAAGKVTILKVDVAAGDQVEVRTYKYATPASTETINIDSTSFPSGVTLVLDTIEINEDEEPLNRIQYTFPQAMMGGSFTVNTASERNAAAQNTTFRIVKPKNSKVVGTIQRIPFE
ncbi:hypothetical protein [Paenibacillus tianjinensis]|uniref:Major tail protein n=1 Tax=Paenibacillus tianjinensis TaxID=2810347 RepID=A0ABX7LA09_9BACL|nr:hypothetical protein [Paenibacillus tianjinensis]QSF43270.1 hypothetical protein JRJ22_18560 [Paenibacillus tianjinensis]